MEIKRDQGRSRRARCIARTVHLLPLEAKVELRVAVERGLLEAWDADAYMVSQLLESEQDAEASRAAMLMLGPRVRMAVQQPPSQLYDAADYGATVNGGGARG